jgi:hypothetical protein
VTAEAKLALALRIVEEQADDEALWSPMTCMEAYVVAALRRLHAVVEWGVDTKESRDA